jgi:hypothetical protein
MPGWSDLKEVAMNVDRAVLTLAGSTVLASLMLAWLVNPYWLLLTAFVGANLFQASFPVSVRRPLCSANRTCIRMSAANRMSVKRAQG